MERDFLSYNKQVGIGTYFLKKSKLLFVFLFSFFIVSFSAQEVKSDVIITVVGDAFIYSKDVVFNEQVAINKDLQQNSKIELSQNNELKISAKSINKNQKEIYLSKKKSENIVLASKRENKYKSIDIPKKSINIHVKDLSQTNQFFAGSRSASTSFIFPTNDSQFSEWFIKPSDWFLDTSVKYSDKIDYFYNNDNSKLQVFHHDLSVRPPPSLI